MPKSCTAADYMAASLVTFRPDTPVLDAIHQLIEKRISGAPVVDSSGDLVGMLTEKDCMKVALSAGYHGEAGGRVAEYMAREVETIDARTSIIDLAQKFLRGSYRRFPVMEDNRMVGQISRRDVLRALQDLTTGDCVGWTG
jgi:CBS domain-containing protein